MFGLDDLFSFASLIRNSYDTVYELGDTSLQFTGDLIRGYDPPRYNAYAHRQINRREKRNISKPAKASVKQPAQKPLNFAQKRSFAQMMGRQHGETIIEHWKRQKQLLAYPDKHTIIVQHEALQDKIKQEAFTENQIKVEMKSISSQYQKTRVHEQSRTRKRGRGR